MSDWARVAVPSKGSLFVESDNTEHLIAPDDRYHAVCGAVLPKGYKEGLWGRQVWRLRTDACKACVSYLARPRVADSDPVIDRIRKLLALAGSPNEAEAALASQRAQELLAKHNLEIGVVDRAGTRDIEEMETELSVDNGVSWNYVWDVKAACDEMFDVRSSWRRDWAGRGIRWKIVFVGLGANVEAAMLTFSYLCASIDTLTAQRRE